MEAKGNLMSLAGWLVGGKGDQSELSLSGSAELKIFNRKEDSQLAL